LRERQEFPRCNNSELIAIWGDAQLREAAKVMLKVKSVNIAKPGTTVRLPRSRR
jgi:hypothetical protein